MTSTAATPDTAVRTYGLIIDGEEIDSAAIVERRSPATGELVSTYVRGTVDDAKRAVAAARAAFDDGPWPQTSGMERARLLNAAAVEMRAAFDLLVSIECAETGKTVAFAEGDVGASIEMFEYAAALAATSHGEAHTDLGPDFTAMVVREPVGVVAMITPWNFPLLLLAQKLPFALAAGCTAVVKPSELTSGSSIELVRILKRVGLPDGVVNLVTGEGSVVGNVLAESDDVDLLSFTGSTVTGSRITEASAGSVKRLSMELGGKAASVVFDDANLDEALDGVLFGALFNQGECCVQGARLLVQDTIADEFVERVARAFERVKVGPPSDTSSHIGPMINGDHLRKVGSMVDDAVRDGAHASVGGRQLTDGALASGEYYAPTLLDGVDPTHAAFHEEIFGPVLTVTRFHDVDEAVTLANATQYGLAGSIWTKDIDKALQTARRMKSGRVWVNTTIDGAPALPAGGMKKSGYGREMGKVGFEEFTEVKSVQIRTGPRTLALPDLADRT